MKYDILSVIILLILSTTVSFGQQDSVVTRKVDEITVSASRIEADQYDVPMAISVYKKDAVQSIRQQLSLQEYISAVPGLFSLNANNYAQDLRISIRGFGARAAFGIRGIKIIVDGVPETTPDGQGQIDNLNLGIIDQIEVIRGPSSSLYGNASGGVINIKTISSLEKPYVELGTAFGAYGMQQYQLEGGVGNEQTSFIGQGSYNTGDGYRDNSGYQNWNFNGRFGHQFINDGQLIVNLNYSNSPKADDPGAITAEAAAEEPLQASMRNLQFKAGEKISQFKIGASYDQNLGENGSLSFYGFGATRGFLGFVPFEFGGVVDLEREYYGSGAKYTLRSVLPGSVNSFQFGIDYASQNDTRLRYLNLDGVQGDLISTQNEVYSALGFYLLDHLDFGSWMISGGVRFDRNAINSESEFVGLGSAETDLKYTSLNPSLGISYNFNELHNLFANYTRSFETPSLTELFADPNGGPGLNEDLNPQIANSFELGIKGRKSNWSYEAVLYRINTKDDLVPFEEEQTIGLTFYRNAGKTIRQGIELSGGYLISKNIHLQTTYTYSDFTYDEFNTVGGDFSGNALPGIPKHQGLIAVKSTEDQGFVYNVQARFIGELFASDGNDISDDAYTIINVQLGYNLKRKGVIVKPYLGINNLLDVKYNDNVRLNAFGGRHFEPGPPLHLFGGVRVRF